MLVRTKRLTRSFIGHPLYLEVRPCEPSEYRLLKRRGHLRAVDSETIPAVLGFCANLSTYLRRDVEGRRQLFLNVDGLPDWPASV